MKMDANGKLSVADPGISEGGAIEGRGLEVALKPPVGPGQSPGGGPRGEAPGSYRIFACKMCFFVNST
jgi:hypothetical protein